MLDEKEPQVGSDYEQESDKAESFICMQQLISTQKSIAAKVMMIIVLVMTWRRWISLIATLVWMINTNMNPIAIQIRPLVALILRVVYLSKSWDGSKRTRQLLVAMGKKCSKLDIYLYVRKEIHSFVWNC